MKKSVLNLRKQYVKANKRTGMRIASNLDFHESLTSQTKYNLNAALVPLKKDLKVPLKIAFPL